METMAHAYTWQHMVKDGNTWQQIATQGHTWPHIATSAKSLLGLYQHYEDIQCKDSVTTIPPIGFVHFSLQCFSVNALFTSCLAHVSYSLMDSVPYSVTTSELFIIFWRRFPLHVVCLTASWNRIDCCQLQGTVEE